MRIERAITQEQLAKKLNISLKTVSHWETGYTEPSITQLIAIADLYSVSLDDLVGREF
ncbi:MAG: helix-turn-helix transcriptional regulator [Clostridia bacterium]|nr:helix-turn-helix transcriptional regulator [Clostridia bacterium]